jgi:molecular chaperone Hsp33
MQAKGSGSLVQFIMADYTSEGHLRGYAGISENATSTDLERLNQKDMSLGDLLGDGYCTIHIDDELSGQSYQGIVELGKNTLSESLENYFMQSVQRNTAVMLAIDHLKSAKGRKKKWHAGGVMLQRTPRDGGIPLRIVTTEDAAQDQDDWNRAKLLLRTTKNEELTNPELSPNSLLYRLFHEEVVSVFHAEKLKAKCRCSRSKIERFLKNMSPVERRELANEQGMIEVICQFFSTTEIFSAEMKE